MEIPNRWQHLSTIFNHLTPEGIHNIDTFFINSFTITTQLRLEKFRETVFHFFLRSSLWCRLSPLLNLFNAPVGKHERHSSEKFINMLRELLFIAPNAAVQRRWCVRPSRHASKVVWFNPFSARHFEPLVVVTLYSFVSFTFSNFIHKSTH